MLRRLNDWLERNIFILSIRRGLTQLIPILLVGSVALVFSSLPIPAYQRYMNVLMGPEWKDFFQFIRDGSFSILSLLMVVSISYAFASEYTASMADALPPILSSMVALGSFTAIAGISKSDFSINGLGAVGVFMAITVALTSSWLFMKLSRIPYLKVKSYSDGADSIFQYAILAIFPAAIVIALFSGVDYFLATVMGISHLQTFISDSLTSFFLGIRSSFLAGLLFMGFIHFFWLFGIHGSNLLEPVAQNIFVPAMTMNQQAIINGTSPLNIFTKTFFDTFVLMGGSGSTLTLIFAIFIIGRNKNILRHAKLSIFPVLFNINELIVFGLPIVLNPVFMVPFFLVPLVLTGISYFFTAIGFVPITIHTVEWTTPIFISGYAATSSMAGSILQLFNLCIGTLIYIPFVRIAEKNSQRKMVTNLKSLYEFFRHYEEKGIRIPLLNRKDDIGSICRLLTADLEHDIRVGNVQLFFQPQVDHLNHVFGAEALLRWNHRVCGMIYPPLVVALAEEANLTDALSHVILDRATYALSEWNESGINDLILSINMSATQLEDHSFPNSMEYYIKKYHLVPGDLEIEITEQVALSGSHEIAESIATLRKMGVRLSMDDFGMGHGSLMYLKEYKFDTVKLDGMLVKELETNSKCRNIVSSIVDLGNSLNYTVIAEYVENAEQRDILHDLGCDHYQGYLFEKALPSTGFLAYCEKMKDNDTHKHK